MPLALLTQSMESVSSIIDELNSTNSTLEKQDILKKYTDNEYLTKVLVFAYDPLVQFNVSSTNVKKYVSNKKYETQKFRKYTELFGLLDDLSNRVVTGNEALKSVNEFVKDLSEPLKSLVYNILDKNLKIRISHKIINKVYRSEGKKGNVIDVFDPVLSHKYDSKFTELDNSWFISRKLDGVRCLIFINPKTKKIKTYSRNGKDLYNTECITNQIDISKFKTNVFLDGEVVFMNRNVSDTDISDGREDFKSVIEIVRKKSKVEDVSNIYYKIFDIIPEDVFFGNAEGVEYSKRYAQIQKIFRNKSKIKIVEQTVHSDNTFDIMTEKSKTLEWEGLMVRKDTLYKSGRTRDLGKIKSFVDDEFTVTDVINGPFRIIDPDTKLERTITCLAAVIINYKKTKVGSGFSIEERKLYYKNPEKIIGKNITVQYFEKTPDSLRFPTFKGIRDYE